VRTMEEREAIARIILLASPETTSQELAERCGIQRETARGIRFGHRYASVLPELPRADQATMLRTCSDCSLFDRRPERVQADGIDKRIIGRCSIGIPEASASIRFARGCGAFTEARP